MNNEIIKLYQDGKTFEEIICKLNTSRYFIKKALVAAGINPKSRNLLQQKYYLFLSQNRSKIINDYLSGLSILAISKKYSTSRVGIRKILKEEKIYKNKTNADFSKFKNKNIKIFDSINNELSAYLLGLIITDGSIRDDKNEFQISLQERDKKVLEEISYAILGINNIKILNRPYPRQNSAKLLVSSKPIIKQLKKIGVSSNKSFTVKWPKIDIPSKLLRHFIRGLIDGDGHINICNTKKGVYRVQFIGSNDFCKVFHEKLLELGFESHLTFENRTTKQMSYVTIWKKNDVFKFVNWIYKDSTFFLERKNPFTRNLESRLLQEIEESHQVLSSDNEL